MSCTNKFSVTDPVHMCIYLISPLFIWGMAATGKEPSPSWQSALALQRETVLGKMVLSNLRYSPFRRLSDSFMHCHRQIN